MSDTRAAIRELRSLSEKRGTQGLTPAERDRLVTLRQRLGLPADPEAPSAPDGAVAGKLAQATAAPVRQAAASSPPAEPQPMPQLAASFPPAEPPPPMPEPAASLPAAEPPPMPEPAASLPAEPPPIPEAAHLAPVDLAPPEAEPPSLGPEAAGPVAVAVDGMGSLPWTELQTPLPQFSPEGSMTAELAPPALFQPEALDAEAADLLAALAEPLPVPEPAAAISFGLGAALEIGTDRLAVMGEAGGEPLHGGAEAGPIPDLAWASTPGVAEAPGQTITGWSGEEAGDAEPLPEATESELAPPQVSPWEASESQDAAVWGAQPIPPDAPQPGEAELPVEAAPGVEDPIGDQLAPVLSPEDLGATPAEPEPPPAEPPLDATRPYPVDGRLRALLGLDEPVATQQESGPIELSAADVMLLEEGEVGGQVEAAPGTAGPAALDLGGDASEPLPLAEAHDFVQYQHADALSVPLDEVAGAGEFLQGAEALQASTAELAAAPEPYTPPSAPPEVRVPSPPPSSAPVPRDPATMSLLGRLTPPPGPLATPSYTPIPAPRPVSSTPLPGSFQPPPGPPSLRPAPLPTPGSTSSPGFPPPPPLRLPRPPPASLIHPTGATPVPGRTPIPFKAPTPPLPVLTPAQPEPGEGAVPQSGPFGLPTVQPAARLDVMDPYDQLGFPSDSRRVPVAPLPPVSPPSPAPPQASTGAAELEPSAQQLVFGSTFLSPTFVEGEHRVVLHTLEGQVKRGTVQDVDLLDAAIRLSQPGQPEDRIPTERVKAIFFMHAPGERPLPQSGRKVRVHFRDGRQLLGFSEDVETGEIGFFLVPADTRTHTTRIFVFRAGVQSITDG